jgi:hypothetical protein
MMLDSRLIWILPAMLLDLWVVRLESGLAIGLLLAQG